MTLLKMIKENQAAKTLLLGNYSNQNFQVMQIFMLFFM